MSNEKDGFNYTASDGKRDFRHMRHTRFTAHPYQTSPQHLQQPHHDSSLPNDATPRGNTSYLNSRLICDSHQPESPFSTETHAEEVKCKYLCNSLFCFLKGRFTK
ncbi:hypothetical protein V9T40_009650 [Parthenolecanium corni]|uniref:Uncharacterized protein n=1 Tax=Parthenolecanium corni TaxID=536013 RepID=A0AAN9Y8D7_9HEMI